MEKNTLLVLIFEAVCGLACIGFGIYYFTCENTTNAVVFLVVGAVCLVMAVRAFIKMRKQKKDNERDENNNTKQ